MGKLYKSLGCLLVGVLLGAGGAQAQFDSFEVVATNPNQGETNVAATTTVSFTFSAPLTDWWGESTGDTLLGELVMVHPCEAIRVNGVSPCETMPLGTLSEDGRTLSFNVEHLANTTYTWSVPELVMTDQEVALRLFSLQYATSSALEGITVEGGVVLESFAEGMPIGQREKFPAQPWMTLPRMLLQPHTTPGAPALPSLMDPLLEATRQPTLRKQGRASLQAINPEGMVVTLLDTHGKVAGSATVTAEGTFAIPHVLDGWYTLEGVLVHYDRVLGQLRIGFAMLDADQDGEADSIQVAGSDLVGLEVIGQGLELTRITALNQLEAATQIATFMLGGSAMLSGIGSISLPFFERTLEVGGAPDGKALLWLYAYSGEGEDPQLLLLIQGSPGTLLPLPIGPASQLGIAGPIPVLPGSMVDSDVAVAAAEDGGGADFRAAHNNEVAVAMLGGLFSLTAEIGEFVYEDPTVPVWVIAYMDLGFLADSLIADSLMEFTAFPAKRSEASVQDAVEVGKVFYADMTSGELLGSRSMVRSQPTAVAPLPGAPPREFALEPNYPNPFRTETAIPFALTQQGPVQVEVFNLLGQQVATLFDGVLPAGRYVVRWRAADQPAGFYLVRLQAEGRQVSRLVLHQR